MSSDTLYCPICDHELHHCDKSETTDEEVIWHLACEFCNIVIHIHHQL